jgi:integrase/recombinase XerD
LAERTIKNTERTVADFADWCKEIEIETPCGVTLIVLERYAQQLCQARTPLGMPLSVEVRHTRLSALRVFFRFLARQNLILASPATDLELPELGHRLPRTVLTHEEAERVLAEPDLRTRIGIRDRTILETLYSTGVRRSELVRLSIFDVDMTRGTVMVREGKGRKDRVVPIGERALDWVERYVADVRPSLGATTSEQTLYLNEEGEPIHPDELGKRVKAYVEAAELGKTGSCHLFRHTMATIMVERGADLRVVQEILGHSKVSTTQIYTQVAIERLKEVHTRTHPAARRVMEPAR